MDLIVVGDVVDIGPHRVRVADVYWLHGGLVEITTTQQTRYLVSPRQVHRVPDEPR